jgi:general secretion pathway protein G
MMDSHATARRSGFTLVELLIVVVILAILAAVVIPQFNSAAHEAKESALVANLGTVRQAIALYRVQHDEVYPGQTDWNEMVTQLTNATNADGTSGGGFGPYLRTGFPINPITAVNTGKNSDVLTSPSGPEGYAYSPVTGELRANTPGTAPSGTAYWEL